MTAITKEQAQSDLREAIQRLKDDRTDERGGVCLHMNDRCWTALINALDVPAVKKTEKIEGLEAGIMNAVEDFKAQVDEALLKNGEIMPCTAPYSRELFIRVERLETLNKAATILSQIIAKMPGKMTMPEMQIASTRWKDQMEDWNSGHNSLREHIMGIIEGGLK